MLGMVMFRNNPLAPVMVVVKLLTNTTV